mmetsp:Transcript_35872/g.67641  ORF Transcript_35872/g.67641 Transcript_35872/m.67641 type:complete len:623 (-) Transcript_35872:404-2272(-)
MGDVELGFLVISAIRSWHGTRRAKPRTKHGLVFGGVLQPHLDVAAVQARAVETLDGFGGLLHTGHGDEGEPAALARDLVHDQAHLHRLAVWRHHVAEALLGDLIGQARDVQLGCVLLQLAPGRHARPRSHARWRASPELRQEALVLVLHLASRLLARKLRDVALVHGVHAALHVLRQLVDFAGSLFLLAKTLLLKVLLIAQSAVDGRQLAQLGALVLVVLLVYGHQQVLHHLPRRVHVLIAVALDQYVQVVVLAVVPPRVTHRALLHRPPPADGDLGVGLPLHALLRVATWPDDEPEKVVPRVLLGWDVQLALLLLRAVVRGRAVGGALLNQLLDGCTACFLQRLPHAHLAGVGAVAGVVVGRLRGGRAFPLRNVRVHQLPAHELVVDLRQALVQLRHLRVLVYRGARGRQQRRRQLHLQAARQGERAVVGDDGEGGGLRWGRGQICILPAAATLAGLLAVSLPGTCSVRVHYAFRRAPSARRRSGGRRGCGRLRLHRGGFVRGSPPAAALASAALALLPAGLRSRTARSRLDALRRLSLPLRIHLRLGLDRTFRRDAAYSRTPGLGLDLAASLAGSLSHRGSRRHLSRAPRRTVSPRLNFRNDCGLVFALNPPFGFPGLGL